LIFSNCYFDDTYDYLPYKISFSVIAFVLASWRYVQLGVAGTFCNVGAFIYQVSVNERYYQGDQ